MPVHTHISQVSQKQLYNTEYSSMYSQPIQPQIVPRMKEKQTSKNQSEWVFICPSRFEKEKKRRKVQDERTMMILSCRHLVGPGSAQHTHGVDRFG